MASSPFPEPKWVKNLPANERHAALVRFRIFLAALYATQSGTTTELSRLCGLHHKTLATKAAIGKISRDNAAKIERIVGREIMPAELLSPPGEDAS